MPASELTPVEYADIGPDVELRDRIRNLAAQHPERECSRLSSDILLAEQIAPDDPQAQHHAAWGLRLIEAIGILFAGRVIVELGRLEIGHRMLPREGLEETERRRRATMVPLVRSAFGYGAYFGTAVLVLGALDFNPMPFLAGAGLLGARRRVRRAVADQ